MGEARAFCSAVAIGDSVDLCAHDESRVARCILSNRFQMSSPERTKSFSRFFFFHPPLLLLHDLFRQLFRSLRVFFMFTSCSQNNGVTVKLVIIKRDGTIVRP